MILLSLNELCQLARKRLSPDERKDVKIWAAEVFRQLKTVESNWGSLEGIKIGIFTGIDLDKAIQTEGEKAVISFLSYLSLDIGLTLLVYFHERKLTILRPEQGADGKLMGQTIQYQELGLPRIVDLIPVKGIKAELTEKIAVYKIAIVLTAQYSPDRVTSIGSESFARTVRRAFRSANSVVDQIKQSS